MFQVPSVRASVLQNPVARPVRRSDLAGQKVHHRGETKISGDIGGTKMHTHEKINGRDPGIIVHIFWGTFSRHGCGTKPTCSISCDARSTYDHKIRYPCFTHGMRNSDEGIGHCRPRVADVTRGQKCHFSSLSTFFLSTG